MRGRSLATVRTVAALMLREMSTRYGRSPGGYVWALLEPLGMIVMLSVGFSLLLRSPSLGNSFLLFYATGYLPLNLYMGVSRMTGKAITFSRPLLFYPGVTWLDSILARFLLNTLTAALVSYILFAGIIWFTGTRTVIEMGTVVGAMGLAALLGLGIGCLTCYLGESFPIWDNVWGIVTRPLMLASGLFYIYEDLPAIAREILWYNPLMHVTGLMRSGFYPMYGASYASLLYVLVWALVPLAFGLMLLRRHHKALINR